MTAESDRTYRIQIDVIVETYVTILEDRSLVIEDAVSGEYVYVAEGKLQEYAISEPPYSAHVADCIANQLLSSEHDECEWHFTQHPVGRWWHRDGKCPTCGRW